MVVGGTPVACRAASMHRTGGRLGRCGFAGRRAKEESSTARRAGHSQGQHRHRGADAPARGAPSAAIALRLPRRHARLSDRQQGPSRARGLRGWTCGFMVWRDLATKGIACDGRRALVDPQARRHSGAARARYPAQRRTAPSRNPALSAGVPFQPRCAHAGRTARAGRGRRGASP
jgi:hypothetical protein